MSINNEKFMQDYREERLFDALIRNFDSQTQSQLKSMYKTNCILKNNNYRKEIEQLKKEIVEEVLSRISVKFETGNAIKEINSLNEAIKQLGR